MALLAAGAFLVQVTMTNRCPSLTRAVQGPERLWCAVLCYRFFCDNRMHTGQLADGTTAPRTVAVAVVGLSNITQVAPAEKSTCFVAAPTGTTQLYCAGFGSLGEAGSDKGSLMLLIVTSLRHTCRSQSHTPCGCGRFNVGNHHRCRFALPMTALQLIVHYTAPQTLRLWASAFVGFTW